MGDNWVYQNPVNGDWKDGYTGKTINSSPPSAFAGDGKEWTYTESCGWQTVPTKTSGSYSGGGSGTSSHGESVSVLLIGLTIICWYLSLCSNVFYILANIFFYLWIGHWIYKKIKQ